MDAHNTSGISRITGEIPQDWASVIKGSPRIDINAGPMGMGISRINTSRQIINTIKETDTGVFPEKSMWIIHSLTPL